jgi:putative Holliday junction resolvase
MGDEVASEIVVPAGPLLGVDYGTRRVGVAVCDREQRIAVPLRVVERQNQIVDAAVFRELVRAEGVVGIVVGLPVHLSGDEGVKAKEARGYGAWLASVTNLPVVYFDERFSSVEAWNALKAGGMKAAKRKKQVDKVAAQVMLQAFLDVKNAAGR